MVCDRRARVPALTPLYLLGLDASSKVNRGYRIPYLGIDASSRLNRGNALPSRARRDFVDLAFLPYLDNARVQPSILNLRVLRVAGAQCSQGIYAMSSLFSISL